MTNKIRTSKKVAKKASKQLRSSKTSKSTGNTYKEFHFKFNFAIKELSFVEYLSYTKGNPNITLTDKGLNVDIDSLDVKKRLWFQLKKFEMN